MEKKTVVYIGPTRCGILLTGTAFCGGYPPNVEKLIKEEPFLKDLMIPVEGLAEAGKEVRNPESALGALYRKAAGGR